MTAKAQQRKQGPKMQKKAEICRKSLGNGAFIAKIGFFSKKVLS